MENKIFESMDAQNSRNYYEYMAEWSTAHS